MNLRKVGSCFLPLGLLLTFYFSKVWGPLLINLVFVEQELATLRVTFKEQRVRNESLKRMKVIMPFLFI